jgi:hypothetical protein
MSMRVYLSGGAERKRKWGPGLLTKASAARAILDLSDEKLYALQIVRSGKADYVVIPDDLAHPSETALKTGGKVKKFSVFMAMLRGGKHKSTASKEKSRPSKKSTSTKKKKSTASKKKKPTASKKKKSTASKKKKSTASKKKKSTASKKKKSTASKKKKSTASKKKKSTASKKKAKKSTSSRKKTAKPKKSTSSRKKTAKPKKSASSRKKTAKPKKSTSGRKKTAKPKKTSTSSKKSASSKKSSASAKKSASAPKKSASKPSDVVLFKDWVKTYRGKSRQEACYDFMWYLAEKVLQQSVLDQAAKMTNRNETMVFLYKKIQLRVHPDKRQSHDPAAKFDTISKELGHCTRTQIANDDTLESFFFN